MNLSESYAHFSGRDPCLREVAGRKSVWEELRSHEAVKLRTGELVKLPAREVVKPRGRRVFKPVKLAARTREVAKLLYHQVSGRWSQNLRSLPVAARTLAGHLLTSVR